MDSHWLVLGIRDIDFLQVLEFSDGCVVDIEAENLAKKMSDQSLELLHALKKIIIELRGSLTLWFWDSREWSKCGNLQWDQTRDKIVVLCHLSLV